MVDNLGCEVTTRIVHRQFATNLDGFIHDFQAFADEEGRQYDIVLFWKHLSEYYNTNYAQANGIVSQALRIASSLLVPRSVCCILDVTSSDNQHEFFPSILNREANQFDATAGATLATVLPVPCARNSRKCQRKACFMQRVFAASHRLCQSERSKVVCRVLAPKQFAASIVNTFTVHNTYRVNAQRPYEACGDGAIGCAQPTSPSGFTGFFTGEKNK